MRSAQPACTASRKALRDRMLASHTHIRAGEAARTDLDVCVSNTQSMYKTWSRSEGPYLLKYCTIPSMHPTMHSAQHARHASTAAAVRSANAHDVSM